MPGVPLLFTVTGRGTAFPPRSWPTRRYDDRTATSPSFALFLEVLLVTTSWASLDAVAPLLLSWRTQLSTSLPLPSAGRVEVRRAGPEGARPVRLLHHARAVDPLLRRLRRRRRRPEPAAACCRQPRVSGGYEPRVDEGAAGEPPDLRRPARGARPGLRRPWAALGPANPARGRVHVRSGQGGSYRVRPAHHARRDRAVHAHCPHRPCLLATAAAVGVAVFLFLAMRGRRLEGEKRTVAMILPVMLTPSKVEATRRWPDVLMRCVTLTSPPELAYSRTIIFCAFAAHVM